MSDYSYLKELHDLELVVTLQHRARGTDPELVHAILQELGRRDREMGMYPHLPNTEEIQLDKMRFGVSAALSDEFVERAAHLEIDTYHDETLRQLIYGVRGYIWQRQIDRTVIEYPRDWWQAFRERFAPEWVKHRWPIVYKREVVESRELFTNLAVPEDAGYKTVLHVTHESELTTREE